MSPEVPLIIFAIAIPIYLFFNWILKKLKIGNDKNGKFLAIIPTVILSPLIYVGLIVIWIFSMSFYTKKDFDRSEWKTNVEARYEMSKDIIDSKILIGKTKEEIIELLGADFYSYGDNHIAYDLGFVPGFMNIDPDYLDIYLVNGKVNKVEQHGG